MEPTESPVSIGIFNSRSHRLRRSIPGPSNRNPLETHRFAPTGLIAPALSHTPHGKRQASRVLTNKRNPIEALSCIHPTASRRGCGPSRSLNRRHRRVLRLDRQGATRAEDPLLGRHQGRERIPHRRAGNEQGAGLPLQLQGSGQLRAADGIAGRWHQGHALG